MLLDDIATRSSGQNLEVVLLDSESDGIEQITETLAGRGEKIDWCVLGEPSSEKTLGDAIRIGRRGSLSGRLTVRGVQGHVAYPQLADNPIRRFAPALHELHQVEWDNGNSRFPPTSFQFVELESASGAVNVTPPALGARFNFRYSTEWHYEQLKVEVERILSAHGLDYELDWHLSGEPFLTGEGTLTDAVVRAVSERTGAPPALSTGGGTSDGRFISPAGADVVELGLVSASIHKINERAALDDVAGLQAMYERILELLLG